MWGKLFEIRAVYRVAHPKKDWGMGELNGSWARAWMNMYLFHPVIFSICSSGSTLCFYPFCSEPLEADFMALCSDFLMCSIKWRHWGDQGARRNWTWSIYNYWLPPCCASIGNDYIPIFKTTVYFLFFWKFIFAITIYTPYTSTLPPAILS